MVALLNTEVEHIVASVLMGVGWIQIVVAEIDPFQFSTECFAGREEQLGAALSARCCVYVVAVNAGAIDQAVLLIEVLGPVAGRSDLPDWVDGIAELQFNSPVAGFTVADHKAAGVFNNDLLFVHAVDIKLGGEAILTITQSDFDAV